MEIQVTTELLEPIEVMEGKFRVEWPSEKELISERDEYLENHMNEAIKEIHSYFPSEDEQVIKLVARMMAETIFMMKKIRKITPLYLGVETKVNKLFKIENNDSDLSMNELQNAKNEITGMDFNIHLDAYLQNARDCATGAFPVEELDAYALGGAVHEFAHIMYYWEAVKGSKSKEHGKFLLDNGPELGLVSHDPDEAYLGSDLEVRARRWELSFLKKYYPSSKMYRRVQKDLSLGQDALAMVRKKEKEIKTTT